MNCVILHTALLFAFAAAPLLLAAQSPDELYEQGKSEYAKGNYRAAQQHFHRAWQSSIQAQGSGQAGELRYLARLARAHLRLREHEQALRHFQAALAIAQNTSGPQSEAAADCHLDIGNTYAQMYEPAPAIAAYRQALEIIEQTYGQESSQAGNAWMNIGTVFHKMGSYQDAETYYLRAFQVFQKSSAPDSEDFNRIYSNMGYLYRKQGDLQKALDYGQKALEIKLKNYAADHPSVAKYHRNIGKVYQQMGAYQAALPYMQEGLRIAEAALGSSHPQAAGAMTELAGVYADLKDYPTALRLYRSGQKRLEQALPPDHPYVLGGYFNLAVVYREQGARQEALAHYQFALKKLGARGYRPTNLIAQACQDIAETWLELNALDSALAYCQLGLQELSADSGSFNDHWDDNPDLGSIQDELACLKLLGTKALVLEALAGQQERPEFMLKAALSTVQLALRLIGKLRQGYASDASRQHLNIGTAELYKTGVKTAMRLYRITGDAAYLWQAFEISESSKASLLWRSLNEGWALLDAELPQAERAALARREKQIANMEEALAEAAELNRAESAQALQSALFEAKQAYAEQLATLEQAYPKFRQLRYALPALDQAALMKKLAAERTSLLAYFYDDRQIYLFLLDENGLQGFAQALPTDFEASIRGIRAVDIATFAYQNSTAAAYLQRVHLLYDLLIGPSHSKLAGKNRLLIIPHGILNYLPFELLAPAKGETSFRSQAYLLREFSIHYAWSAAIWAKAPPERHKASLAFAGFAPSYPAEASPSGYRSQLAELTFSASEAKAGKRWFGGKVFLEGDATESAFRESAPRCRILHLAAHAIADDERPLQSGIAFSLGGDTLADGFLHAYEIYQLALPAELAVISACNSGFGRLAEGEGAISLGRAFFHAGCRSIVVSQWLANDHSSAQLMVNFYDYLAQGFAKDEALRQAKLDYLEAADPLTAHPYFWAGLVAVGDMRPISSNERSSRKWLWLMGLAVFLLVFLAFARSKYGYQRGTALRR
jgi:CHAT domain-containing protein/tetratricopeptide (TPR) repeat protein